MINISGHYREERNITGYCDNDVPLMVNCCGKQIFQTQDYFCNRKDGRLDYQIIYIHRGSGHFDNKKGSCCPIDNHLSIVQQPHAFFSRAYETFSVK